MKIFRVQDKDGRGPYKPGFSHRWVSNQEPKPTCMDEFGWYFFTKIKPDEHCGCGFRTLEQLNNWFTARELIKLKEFGYNIVELEVDRIVFESKNQVVFARRKSLKV